MSMEAHIARWFRDEWPRLKSKVLREFGWQILEDPDFTEPGKAIYFCKREVAANPGLKIEAGVEWEPTPLPANTAAQVAARLTKGNLFRHPDERPSVEWVGEQLLAVDPDLKREDAPPPTYTHTIGKNEYGFNTWDAYINFMTSKKLPVNEGLCPPDVKARLKKFPWSCMQHNLGFSNARMAKAHVRDCMRRPGRPVHLSVEEMRKD